MTAAEVTAGAAVPVLAVGGSAGSLGPLLRLVRSLPQDFPAAVLVTTHLGDSRHSRLPEILGRRSHLHADWARHDEPLLPARVYVAPPGFHLLARPDRITLNSGPRVNRHRPSVDAMFASVASTLGRLTVAVILSGALDDGAVGAALVAAAGGEVVVEDPTSAEFPGMPTAALRAVSRAEVAGEDQLADYAALAVQRVLSKLNLSRGEIPHEPDETIPDPDTKEGAMSMAEGSDLGYLSERESRLTRLACPECGGSLAQVDLAEISYFQCHVGHQYAPESLAAAQSESAEAKLWSAVAALEEEAAFQRYLQTQVDHSGSAREEHRRRAEEIAARAGQLRVLVKAWSPLPQQLPQA